MARRGCFHGQFQRSRSRAIIKLAILDVLKSSSMLKQMDIIPDAGDLQNRLSDIPDSDARQRSIERQRTHNGGRSKNRIAKGCEVSCAIMIRIKGEQGALRQNTLYNRRKQLVARWLYNEKCMNLSSTPSVILCVYTINPLSV